MGSGSNRKPGGGFLTLEWEAEPKTIEGVKVLYNDTNKRSNDLPAYSNSSSMYFKRDVLGEIVQLRVYDKRHRAKYDIDINPKKPHLNRDGTMISAGITHIHEWLVDAKGNLVRSRKGRLLTESEIRKFGKILEAANENVRYK